MSDHDRTHDLADQSVLALLERADEQAPSMSVHPEAIVATGRRKVRRSRGAAVGVGALALAGGLWLGNGLLPGTPADTPAPATIAWQDGVDVPLFDNSPHSSEVGRVHWTGQLRSAPGSSHPQLLLTRNGEELAPIAAEDGPGDTLVFSAEGITVAAWQPPADSIGESPVWAQGAEWGQGADVDIQGTELRYAVSEFVPGASGKLEDLYVFTADGARAASGAAVESTRLQIGGVSVVLMVDQARDVWGGVRSDERGAGTIDVQRLRAGAGLSGLIGEEVVATSFGVLPAGGAAPATSDNAELVQAQLGEHVAVLATSPTMTASAPPIRFTLDGEQHSLETFYQVDARALRVGQAQVTVTGTPDAVELWLDDRWAVVTPEDLSADSAVTVPVQDGAVVLVAGWEPASSDDLRVLVGSDGDQQWVKPAGTLITTTFDGAPLVALSLDEAPKDGGTVRGVGELDGSGKVTEHELKGGTTVRDAGL